LTTCMDLLLHIIGHKKLDCALERLDKFSIASGGIGCDYCLSNDVACVILHELMDY